MLDPHHNLSLNPQMLLAGIYGEVAEKLGKVHLLVCLHRKRILNQLLDGLAMTAFIVLTGTQQNQRISRLQGLHRP